MKIGDLFFSYFGYIIANYWAAIKPMSFVGRLFLRCNCSYTCQSTINASGRKTNAILTLGMALLFVYLCFWYILIGASCKASCTTGKYESNNE